MRGRALPRLRAFVHKALTASRARAMARARGAGAPVIPTVRYRDVPAAIAWLCTAFGMEAHRVVAGEDGTPCYAELTFGRGMLMVAPIEDTAFGKLMVQPDEIGGVETQVCYLSVLDAQAHYARAKAAGAEIVLDIEEEANDGRGYSCRDPEGHVWNFGTYDPWEKQRDGAPSDSRHPRREQQGLAALLLLSLMVVLTSEAVPQPPSARAGAAVTEMQAREYLALEQRRPEAAEQPAKEQRVPPTHVHSAALHAAERIAADARAQLAEVRGAQQMAERAAAAAHVQLEELRNAKQAAERSVTQARELLVAAQKNAERAREEAALERTKRLAADHAAARARKRVASFRYFRPRPRVWCYNPNVSVPASNSGSRLSGFCKT